MRLFTKETLKEEREQRGHIYQKAIGSFMIQA